MMGIDSFDIDVEHLARARRSLAPERGSSHQGRRGVSTVVIY